MQLMNLFKINTVGTKISFICLIDCLILVVLIIYFVTQAMIALEGSIISEQLETDIQLLDSLFEGDESEPWSLRDGVLYRGEHPIGDGKLENADQRPMKELIERTGTYGSVGIRVSDEMADGFGHYMYVSTTPVKNKENNIIGKFIDRDIANSLDKTGTYSSDGYFKNAYVYSHYRLIYNEQGENIGFICVGRDIREVRAIATEAGNTILILLGILALLSVIGISIVSNQWTQGISKIKSFLGRISSGDYPEEKLILNSRDEIGLIANSINDMISSLKNTKRIDLELALASDIQAHMLPCIFPAFPEATEFDVFASMAPAKEVGGDFYDFFMLDDKHIAVVIADVSGKGIPSALVMVIAKTLIKNHILYGLDPGEAFTSVNKMLCEGNDNCMFVTSWLGVLDTETGVLSYVNAGHNPPLVLRDNASFEYLHSRPGFVLAGMEGIRYKMNEMQLSPNDRLFLYTDGVTEAVNPAQDAYGEARLQAFLNAHKDEPAPALLKNLKLDIDSFKGEAEQFDDITMLMLDFKKYFVHNGIIEKLFPADIAELETVTAYLEEELEKIDCPSKIVIQLSMVLEEIFVNIAHYAYPGIRGIVRIATYRENDGIVIRFTDTGIPFNPLDVADPDIKSAPEERDLGGLGIYLIKKTTDDVQYEYKNGQNILKVYKKLHA